MHLVSQSNSILTIIAQHAPVIEALLVAEEHSGELRRMSSS
jgi:hypothetical protein